MKNFVTKIFVLFLKLPIPLSHFRLLPEIIINTTAVGIKLHSESLNGIRDAG
jgi:hypothetical protein